MFYLKKLKWFTLEGKKMFGETKILQRGSLRDECFGHMMGNSVRS